MLSTQVSCRSDLCGLVMRCCSDMTKFRDLVSPGFHPVPSGEEVSANLADGARGASALEDRLRVDPWPYHCCPCDPEGVT